MNADGLPGPAVPGERVLWTGRREGRPPAGCAWRGCAAAGIGLAALALLVILGRIDETVRPGSIFFAVSYDGMTTYYLSPIVPLVPLVAAERLRAMTWRARRYAITDHRVLVWGDGPSVSLLHAEIVESRRDDAFIELLARNGMHIRIEGLAREILAEVRVLLDRAAGRGGTPPA